MTGPADTQQGFGSPAVRHAFTLRAGDDATGRFRADAPADAPNRARIAATVGLRPDRLAIVRQVHGRDVEILQAPPSEPAPEADAIVTTHPDLALTILTADCAPVLLADPQAKVIAAAHAGWRGALAGITDATVQAMAAAGARRDRIRAIVGPTISQANYEVGPEVIEALHADDPANAALFAPSGRDGHALFNLPGYVLARLRAVGIGQATWTGDCTYADAARFFSHRRNTHNGTPGRGRLAALIALAS